MWYLFLQTLFWLLLALIVGFICGWIFRGYQSRSRIKYLEEELEKCQSRYSTSQDDDLSRSATEPEPTPDDWRPTTLSAPEGEADDLKRISGIGPVIEETLNGLGIFNYRQIAEFTRENIAWVNKHILFPGRIDRENWVGQARLLNEGRKTDFADHYDKGEAGSGNPNT